MTNATAFARKAYARMDMKELLALYEERVDRALIDTLARINMNLPDTERVGCEYSVKYRGPLGKGDNLMFSFDIALHGTVVMDDVIALAQALQVFETCEFDPVDYAGMKFTLGDGDDRLAVQFLEGKFSIWLRAWHPDHVGGV
jgi:hypothetical protein